MGLDGKRVVIIGGSSGIGRAVAAKALGEGAEVFIGSSRQEKIDEARQLLAGNVDGAAVDVTSEESIKAFFEKAGAFDHLVFTAGNWGSRPPKSAGEVEIEDFTDLLSVRFYGAMLAVKHGSANIREGGSVTLTSGISAHRPRKGAPLPSTMGGSVEHLTRALAVDLAPVRVNAVCPGVVGTEVWGDNAEEQFRAFIDSLLLTRIGQPDEVAEAYMYTMKCGYVTGQIMRVDGGRSLV